VTDQESAGEKTGRPDWMKDAEAAFEKLGDSIGAAWEATKDVRLAALESAKTAAKQLSEAIDRGVEAARQQWNQGQASEEE
jgi:hypothetical protein